MNPNLIYPRAGDRETVYLKNVVNDPSIIVGDYTMYNDFAHDPREFAANNVLYHYYVNRDRLIIGKYCSIACGAKFLFNSANHSLRSLSTYPFPIFYDEWGLDVQRVTDAWDNEGDIVVGNDVWLGRECVVMPGVKIGDGAIVAAYSVVTRDVAPYTVAGGNPARFIKNRFDEELTGLLLRLKWWDLPPEELVAWLPILCDENLENLRSALKSRLD